MESLGTSLISYATGIIARQCVSDGVAQCLAHLACLMVRQGSILSPYLFNVYMDRLSHLLNKYRTGCLSGEAVVNRLMYADNLVLISPSATGLQELVHACEGYSEEHDIRYNSKKSSVLICRNKAMMHAITSPSFVINGNVIEELVKVKGMCPKIPLCVICVHSYTNIL